MEKAIKRAIKGGFTPFMELPSIERTPTKLERIMSIELKYKERVLLDPMFWKSLSNAEGWDNKDVVTSSAEYREWQGQMHRFIDHIIEGKPIDTFFDELLAKE